MPATGPLGTRVHPVGVPHAPGAQPGRRPYLPYEPVSDARADKVYLVTRADLSAGQQITQTAHAMSLLAEHSLDTYRTWRRRSDSIIVLTVPGVAELLELTHTARAGGVDFATWREEDLADELTAVLFTPSQATADLLAGLSLAGRTPPPATAVRRESDLRRLVGKMRDCEQMPGMSVLQHGRAVRETYLALLDIASGHVDPDLEDGWRLPDWLTLRGPELIAAQQPPHLVEEYLTLHDCGKPRVRVIDQDGKSHFPGHAQASVAQYRKYVRSHPHSAVVAEMIGMDMLIHTVAADAIAELAKHPSSATLLLAAVAEVHANAAMFGGTSSDSFKAKMRKVDQRGRAMIRVWDAPGGPGWPRPHPQVANAAAVAQEEVTVK